MAAISDSACRYVGVDLHKQTITIAAVEGTRKLISRKRFSNLQTDAIIAFLKSFAPFELVVEATASHAGWHLPERNDPVKCNYGWVCGCYGGWGYGS